MIVILVVGGGEARWCTGRSATGRNCQVAQTVLANTETVPCRAA
jgi:hypothetical protein